MRKAGGSQDVMREIRDAESRRSAAQQAGGSLREEREVRHARSERLAV